MTGPRQGSRVGSVVGYALGLGAGVVFGHPYVANMVLDRWPVVFVTAGVLGLLVMGAVAGVAVYFAYGLAVMLIG